MNNYLLSIDPSIKNTGFTLWENKKPIWINSYDFKKIKNDDDFYKQIKCFIYIKIYYQEGFSNNNFDLIIERGTFHSKNGIGYETQEHLRGFIAGQFNKLLTKDMLISPSSWKKWYKENYKNIEINYNNWKKEYSLILVKDLITLNNWNITISNHDEADSLLIGWYYLNKEVNNET